MIGTLIVVAVVGIAGVVAWFDRASIKARAEAAEGKLITAAIQAEHKVKGELLNIVATAVVDAKIEAKKLDAAVANEVHKALDAARRAITNKL